MKAIIKNQWTVLPKDYPLLTDNRFLRISASTGGVFFRLTELTPGSVTVSASHLVCFVKMETARNQAVQFEITIEFLKAMLEMEKIRIGSAR